MFPRYAGGVLAEGDVSHVVRGLNRPVALHGFGEERGEGRAPRAGKTVKRPTAVSTSARIPRQHLEVRREYPNKAVELPALL